MREAKRDVHVPPLTQILNRVGMRRSGDLLCDVGRQTVLGHGAKAARTDTQSPDRRWSAYAAVACGSDVTPYRAISF